MRIAIPCFLMMLAACGGGAAAEGTRSATPATFADQVALGQKLYGEKCASCHGSSGEGDRAPRVVGLDKGALPLDPRPDAKVRKTQFRTAADVATFVVKNMPPGGDSSLREEDYWAILAFDLHANGVDLPQRVDATNASTIVLHK